MLLAIARLLIPLVIIPAQAPQDGDGPPRPPREALEACEGQSAGDACSFEGREGEEVSGTCFTPAEDKPLACRPDHPPR